MRQLIKILSSILFCNMLICSSCFGKEDRFYSIYDFSGGLNANLSEFVTPANQAVTLQNVRIDDTIGALTKRYPLVTYGTMGSFAVKGKHRYYKSAGTDILIAAGSTFLKTGNDTTGEFTIIKEGLTSAKRWQFVTYKDIAIGINGYDNNQKYDGHTQVTANTDGSRTASNLTADLGAPFSELNTGSNLDASSWYQYKIAFYTGSVYYFSNARSNAIQTGSTVRDITLTNIPLGKSGITTRYVYRTVGNASKAAVEADTVFYLVATISDNTTTTINDAMSDDTADNGATPVWGTVDDGLEVTPPKGKIALLHKERLFIAGNQTYKSDLFWSEAYNPDFFIPSEYEQIRPDDGDEITGLLNELGNLVVFKTNTVQKFYTVSTATTGWYASAPYEHIGCIAPYSLTNSPLGIFYLSWNGIYLFNGQNSQFMSDAVTPQIEDILITNIDNCVGVYFNNRYYLSYTSIAGGGSINNRVLVYDILRKSFVQDLVELDSFCVLNSGADLGTLYAGSSDSDGYVYKYLTTGTTTETAIASTWKSGITDFGITGYKKYLDRIRIFYNGTAGTLTVNYKNIESDINQSFDIDLSVAPDTSATDLYKGFSGKKYYTFYTKINAGTGWDTAIGDLWQFQITESGVTNWEVYKIEIRFAVTNKDD